MLGQPKKYILSFIKLLSLNSKDPTATESRWNERFRYLVMNNGEWPTLIKNINELIDKNEQTSVE